MQSMNCLDELDLCLERVRVCSCSPGWSPAASAADCSTAEGRTLGTPNKGLPPTARPESTESALVPLRATSDGSNSETICWFIGLSVFGHKLPVAHDCGSSTGLSLSLLWDCWGTTALCTGCSAPPAERRRCGISGNICKEKKLEMTTQYTVHPVNELCWWKFRELSKKNQ